MRSEITTTRMEWGYNQSNMKWRSVYIQQLDELGRILMAYDRMYGLHIDIKHFWHMYYISNEK